MHLQMANQISIFGIDIDVLEMPGAVSRLQTALNSDSFDCQYLVTPNTDHIVMLQSNTLLQESYKQSFMCVADGWPVVAASRLLKKPLPCTIPGSDLLPALLANLDRTNNHNKKYKVFLFGAGEGVAVRAGAVIEKTWGENIEIVGAVSPEFGFDKDANASSKYAAIISNAQPDVLVLGLGAPKQEVWVYKFQSELKVKVALCVGATIDFIAGEKKRAPLWIQRSKLEWLYRIYQEPRRLAKRYLNDALVFPLILIKEIFNGKT